MNEPKLTDERAKFEAWALETKLAYRDAHGFWYSPSVDGYSVWKGWQARAAIPTPAAITGLLTADREVLKAVYEHLEKQGNAPGHSHAIPGIWDSDNGGLAGKPCDWCLTWDKFRALIAAMEQAPASPSYYEQMRLTLIGQVHELIDIAERHAWTKDAEEKRRTLGAIEHARKVTAPYNYNGATPAAEQGPASVARPPSLDVALNMCREANSEAKLPTPMCWDLALYVGRLEQALAAPASVAGMGGWMPIETAPKMAPISSPEIPDNCFDAATPPLPAQGPAGQGDGS